MNHFSIKRTRIIISMVIGFLLTITTVFGYQIEHYSEIYLNMAVGGLIIFLFAVITIILLLIYNMFDKATVNSNKSINIKQWKIYLISLGSLLGIYAIQFLAVYPGLFVFDASWQYWMYIENTISEHQPVLHTVLLGYIVDTIHRFSGAINHGAAVYTIFQIVICAACMAYLIMFVYGKLKRISVLVAMLIFFGVYPPIILQVMSATKDTFFMALIILVITMTIEMVEDCEKFCHNWVKIIIWIFATVFMIIFRNNCIYAIPFLVYALVKVMRKKRFFVCAIFAGVFLLYVVYKLFFVPAYVTVEVDGREMYSVPTQQIMRIYNSDKANMSDYEREEIEKLFIEDARENYHPRIADMAKGNLDMVYYRENSSEINKMYLSLLKKNFKLSIESFLENTCGFWYPGSELTLYKDGTKGYWVVNCYYPIVSNPKIQCAFEFYKLFENSDFVTKNPVTSLLFSPGTFFYIFIIMFGYAIDNKNKPYIVVFFFIFALWLTYLLGPVALVRYVIYLYGIVPIYFVMIINKKKKKNCGKNK